ncbi:MAG: two-CW domain-containing protein [Deltaproteobacteria bacterium]
MRSDFKINCWEFQRCERQPGGKLAGTHGVCPASSDQAVDGINGGKNGGRFCCAIAGTLCFGKVHCTNALKIHDCTNCGFLYLVANEEDNFTISTNGLRKSSLKKSIGH